MDDQKTAEEKRKELDAMIAAGEEEDRQAKRRLIRNVIIGAVVLILGIGAYTLFRPEYIPDVYVNADGNVDWVKQAEKFRKEGKYKEVYDYHAQYAVVSDGKKYGLIDVKGNLVVPVKYDEVSSFSDPYPHLSLVRLGNKYGLVNLQGKEQVPVIYDEISVPSGGVMKVKKGDQEFYIDDQGKQVEN